MSKSRKPILPMWRVYCYACGEREEYERAKQPDKCRKCGRKTSDDSDQLPLFAEQVFTPWERAVAEHKEWFAKYGPKCRAMGDFGHTNVWGTPYLKFDICCGLPIGHEGKHSARLDIRIAPTSETNGRIVDRKSVEVTGEARVHWTIDAETEDKVRWNGLLGMLHCLGRFVEQDMRRGLAAPTAERSSATPRK